MTEQEASEITCSNPAWQGKPYGWIQWKGTDACIDLHCACGHHCHLDEEFLYAWQCHQCGRKYLLDCHVQLVEVTEPSLDGHTSPDSIKGEPLGSACPIRSE
jgi:hypothetical protein